MISSECDRFEVGFKGKNIVELTLSNFLALPRWFF